MATTTKGREGGACNRAACQKPGARWWNTGSRAWYCDECARRINAYTPNLCVTRVSLPPDPTPEGARAR